jgi:hypothetical protein
LDHVLARIRGVKLEDIKRMLKADAEKHAEEGLLLRHLWHNLDDPSEILFIFATPNLNRARKFIETTHAQARKREANANLPQMIFLKGE